MSNVYVIEHGSDPRPARVLYDPARISNEWREYICVEFTDQRGGKRLCLPSSVFPTKAEAVRAEKEMESHK